MKNKILNLLGLATRAGNIVAGNNACENALKMKKIKMLVISEEASEKTKKNYKFYADKYNIPIIFIGTIEVKDINIVKGIQKLINGGEAIG